MSDNVLKFDFLADGKSASLTITRLGEKFEGLADKVDKVDGKTTKLGGSFGFLQSRAAKLTATAVSLSSALGPATVGMVALAKGAVSVGIELAPAAAALPAFAAGALLVKHTLTSVGPAMAKSFAPVTDAFHRGQAEVDKLATKGLPRLGREFTKVNFPQIHTAMLGIATQTNGVVLAVGKWVDSASGQSAIGTILKGTVTFTKQLADLLPGVAISFGNMVGRAAGPGFAALNGLGPTLQRIAAGARRLFDSVSSADVGRAFDAIKGYGAKFLTFGHVIVDVGVWMSQNQGKVKAFSDALAGIGIALSIATKSNPIGALIGGLVILANHWDLVKSAAGKVADAFGGVSGQGSVLSGVFSDLSSWWSDKLMPAFKRAGEALLPTLRDAVESVTQTLKDNKDTIAKVQGVVAALGVVFTDVVIPAYTIMYQVAIPLATAQFRIAVGVIGDVATGVRIMANTFLDSLGYIAHGFADTFGALPGVGSQLKEAAAKFDAFRKKVNEALDGIHDHTVNVTINTRYQNFGTPAGTVIPAWYGKRAAGGPVWKGMPYLVGERGPELFTPSASGRISDHRTTAAMGGGGRTVLELRSSGAAVDDMLLKILRHAIRVRGGDVQLVLSR